jgi:DNA uptake protein ComE-like DNA-binding protein
VDHNLPTMEREESMAENERRTIDPNAADVKTLSELPGIGPEMAQRIIDARPFERAEDLTKVQGIGPTVLARHEPG